MVKCPGCSSENNSDAKFCHNCGAKLNASISKKDPYNLDGKKRDYGSTTGKSAGSASAYYDHSANSGSSSSGSKGINQTFQKMGTPKRLLAFCCLAFIILFAISAVFQGLGVNMDSYTEDQDPIHDYMSLDLDGDGALSLEELEAEYSNVSASDMESIFEEADKNGNGLIKGGEYDKVNRLVQKHFNDLEKQKTQKSSSSSKSSSKSSSSSSSKKSSSSKDLSYGYNGICMYCGSDQYSRSSDGMGNYECDDCGSYLYDMDIIEMDDLRCPKCGGHVSSKNGDTFKCKKCGKKFSYLQLDIK